MSTINSASHRRCDLENPSHCHIADFTVSERIEANTGDDGEVGGGGWGGKKKGWRYYLVEVDTSKSCHLSRKYPEPKKPQLIETPFTTGICCL